MGEKTLYINNCSVGSTLWPSGYAAASHGLLMLDY